MITNFKIFENIADIPKVGGYYLIATLKTACKTCKIEVLEVKDYYNVHKIKFLFLDVENKLNINTNWIVITPKEMIRCLTPKEIKEFELIKDLNKYNL